MWRCAASLERLATEPKEAFGNALVKELGRPNLAGHVLWCLGRLGARVPLYGPANTTVSRETAERWIDSLLVRSYGPGRESTEALFALGQLAQVSGDRARDIEPDLRRKVIEKLTQIGASEDDIRPVREYTEREAVEQGVALGDSLPVGLRLINQPESAGV
jgi:hypothetical protein